KETNFGFTATIDTTGINSNARKNESINVPVSKWNMDITTCPTKGVQWSYSFNAKDFYKAGAHRKTINLQLHSGCWYPTRKMKGFYITIVQVLRCELKPKPNVFSFKTKPEIIKKCPQIVHTLKISFNDITNFNDKFAELSKSLHMEHEEIGIMLGKNSLSSMNDSQKAGIMGID
ncbi:12302_t:CDS:1, partial [Racocetra fulgida]